MRITLRVFVTTLVAIILVLAAARLGEPDCLRLVGDEYAQVIDTKSGTIFPRNPIHPNEVSSYYDVFYHSPDNAYRGNFQARSLPDGKTAFDFQLVAKDKLGNLVGRPHVVYPDVVQVELGGADPSCVMVDATWQPDSRHILLHWMPDYFRFYCGNRYENPLITQSIHEFALIDVHGNVSRRITKTLPIHMYDEVNGDLETVFVEGFLPDENMLVLQHSAGTMDSAIELWSLSDFQAVDSPIPYDINSCYSPYESSAVYCFNWSPDGRIVSVISKQADGSRIVVIHDFESGQRHTIPLPTAPDMEYLLSSWSPNGKYEVVSWFVDGKVTRLMFDRNGTTVGIIPNGVLEDPYRTPWHNWTADGNGLLFYTHDVYWNPKGNVSKLYLGNLQRLISLPAYLVNDSWYTGAAARGSRIALVWNEVDERHQLNEVRIGVVNTETGDLTTLYKFKDRLIGEDEPIWIQWLSDTRLAVETSFGFAWGNTDGSDWHEPPEPVSVVQNTFASDGTSVLVFKRTETQQPAYVLNLETATLHLIMPSKDTSLTEYNLGRSPSGRFVFRYLINMSNEYHFQIVDSQTQTPHTYDVESLASPLWSPDEQQLMLVTVDTHNRQHLRLFSATTDEVLHHTSRAPLAGEGNITSLGRCY